MWRVPSAQGNRLWYAKAGPAGWTAPNLNAAAVDSTDPRLAVGPDGSLHAAWVTYDTGSDAYAVDYLQGNRDAPYWIAPSDRVLPTQYSRTPSLFVGAFPWDNQPHPNVVWSEAGTIHYSYRSSGRFGAGPAGPNPYFYQGNTPVVAVVNGRYTNGTGSSSVHLLWSGLDSLDNSRVISWGASFIDREWGDFHWSDPVTVSSNISSTLKSLSTTATCPIHNALAPSAALAPDGTLYAVWNEQQADCTYSVLTSHLDYFNGQGWDFAWSVPERASSTALQQGTSEGLAPHLAFDGAGRRYVLWNSNGRDVLVARSTGPGVWENPTKLNTGACAGQLDASGRAVDAVDLAAQDALGIQIHAVWVARDPAGDKICYSQLNALPYHAYLPRISRKTDTHQ